MAHWYRLGVAIGLTALVGCGNPTPEGPVSGSSIGSANAVVSSPAGDAPRASLAAPQAPTPETRRTDSSRATSPAPDARVPPAASPANLPPSDVQTIADQAQREARELWFAELRESPDATVRLQALALWAQQPGDGIDPLTYALVDEDEAVRARAEALYAQQRAREEAETAL